MSEPFIFIGTHSLKEGKLEDFKKYEQELVELVEANEPRLIGFHIFLNQDGTQCRFSARRSARPTSSWKGRRASRSMGGPATRSWR